MRRKSVLVVAAMLVLGSCESESAILIGAEANGATVTVPIGSIVEVALAANPTTGFTWEVVGVDEAILRQQGEATFEPETTLVGASGEMRFTFEAVATGTTTLEMVYHRTFETADPADTFTVTVIVEE